MAAAALINVLLCAGGLFTILSTIGLVLYLVKFKHMIDITNNLPSPPSLPIVGHGHHFAGKPPHENMYTIYEFASKYGPTFKVWLGTELNIWTSDLKDVEVILGTTRFNDKAHEYDTLEPWLKEGLLTSRGRKWHSRRKVLTPAFHFKILESFIDVFEKESRTLVANLDKEYRMQTDKGFDLYDWVNLCTLDTICGKKEV